ncbi:hypothetical protein [Streptomyces syringium]|uniref:hypothetical protein n=1 Tax=Streptomyces syringium TaxID=76729 RepID=UPI003452E6A4
MSSDGDPPPSPPGSPFWAHVWKYWVTAGLALVVAAVIPVFMKTGPFAGGTTPPPTPPPATTPIDDPSPSGDDGTPEDDNTPTPRPRMTTPAASTRPPSPPTVHVSPPVSPSPSASAPLRVSARIADVRALGPVTSSVTKVQVNAVFNGLKGRTGYLRWYLYNEATKQVISSVSTIPSPAFRWDSTNWHPTFLVANPATRWQIQVTAYGPDGRQLATNHSNFTFGG